MEKGLISVIIVTWNSEATLPACLSSVRGQDYKAYEIIIVDNGSTDGTLSSIACSGIRLIENGRNLGFSKANNQALAIACGEYVLLLNSDAVIAPGYFSAMIPFFERDPRLGSASGKILRPSGDGVNVLDSTGLQMQHWRLLPCDRGEGETDRGQYDEAALVFGAPGACALYRRTALEEAASGQEFLDEDFFAYYEDVDLAWRMRRRGWKAVYVPAAIAYHRKKGPNGKAPFIQVKGFTNRYWCYIKNALPSEFLVYAPAAVCWEILRICRKLILEPCWIRPYLAEWRLFRKMLDKRRAIGVQERSGADAQPFCNYRQL